MIAGDSSVHHGGSMSVGRGSQWLILRAALPRPRARACSARPPAGRSGRTRMRQRSPPAAGPAASSASPASAVTSPSPRASKSGPRIACSATASSTCAPPRPRSLPEHDRSAQLAESKATKASLWRNGWPASGHSRAVASFFEHRAGVRESAELAGGGPAQREVRFNTWLPCLRRAAQAGAVQAGPTVRATREARPAPDRRLGGSGGRGQGRTCSRQLPGVIATGSLACPLRRAPPCAAAVRQHSDDAPASSLRQRPGVTYHTSPHQSGHRLG